MKPAAPGTGVIAGGAARIILEEAGVHDVLCKSLGSANHINVARATIAGLKSLQRPDEVAARRGLAAEDFVPKGMLKAYNERQQQRRRRNVARVSDVMSDKLDHRHPGQVGRSAPSRRRRGTLRALGLGRIGKTNTLPDRPEIRGMIARVPHLVRVETQRTRELTMQVHDLSPAPGVDEVAQAGRPRHRRQGRQDRRPRHQGPARPRHRRRAASKAARCRSSSGCPS